MKKYLFLLVILASFSCNSLNESSDPLVVAENILIQKQNLDNELAEFSSMMRYQGITFGSLKGVKEFGGKYFRENLNELDVFDATFNISLDYTKDMGASNRIANSPELNAFIAKINKEIKEIKDYNLILNYIDTEIVVAFSRNDLDADLKQEVMNYLVFQSVFIKFYNENLDLIYDDKVSSRILQCGVDQGTALDIGLAIWGGALIGAGSGAVGGSVVPGVGTAVGALGGFLVGAISGAISSAAYTMVSQAIQCA